MAFAIKSFNSLIIISLSSVPSSEVALIFSRYPSIASRHLNRRSIIGLSTGILPLLTSWNTFSISCVKCCILLNPIVPAIPLSECAARNTSLMVSLLSGSFSSVMIQSLKVCRCSALSSINISRYWLTSILFYPHILYDRFCNRSKRNYLVDHSSFRDCSRHTIYHACLCILCNNMNRFRPVQ